MIKFEGPKIIVESFQCSRGVVAMQDADMTPLQGQMVRIYLDDNLNVAINPKQDMYWQLAEMMLPPPMTRQIDQGSVLSAVSNVAYIMRGESAIDAIDTEGGRIARVGQFWQNYRQDIEWRVVSGGIEWLTERTPKAGEEYSIIIENLLESPNIITEAVSLDLAMVEIKTFGLPE